MKLVKPLSGSAQNRNEKLSLLLKRTSNVGDENVKESKRKRKSGDAVKSTRGRM